MPSIVILGSLKHHPYEVLYVPHPVEEGREEALQKCSAAIDRANEVVVYAREGIGEHTWKDICYARQQGKRITVIGSPFRKHETLEGTVICVICDSYEVDTRQALRRHLERHLWVSDSK